MTTIIKIKSLRDPWTYNPTLSREPKPIKSTYDAIFTLDSLVFKQSEKVTGLSSNGKQWFKWSENSAIICKVKTSRLGDRYLAIYKTTGKDGLNSISIDRLDYLLFRGETSLIEKFCVQNCLVDVGLPPLDAISKAMYPSLTRGRLRPPRHMVGILRIYSMAKLSPVSYSLKEACKKAFKFEFIPKQITSIYNSPHPTILAQEYVDA